jgi:hypothetical protein
MFQASVDQMTATEPPRVLDELEFIVRPVDTSRGSMLDGDKYSLELSSLDSDGKSFTCMPEFSRFLLHLAGETELSIADDPIRIYEHHQTGPITPNTFNDRLIR